MQKLINEVKSISIVMIFVLLIMTGYIQYLILNMTEDNKSNMEISDKAREFIERTDNIEELRGVSLLLLDSKIKQSNYPINNIKNTRNTLLGYTIFPIFILFYMYRFKNSISNKQKNSDN